MYMHKGGATRSSIGLTLKSPTYGKVSAPGHRGRYDATEFLIGKRATGGNPQRSVARPAYTSLSGMNNEPVRGT